MVPGKNSANARRGAEGTLEGRDRRILTEQRPDTNRRRGVERSPGKSPPRGGETPEEIHKEELCSLVLGNCLGSLEEGGMAGKGRVGIARNH